MNKEKILREAGITKDFERYEVDELSTEYKIYDTRADILGCVLAGLDLKDINKDGYKDVTSSVKAMKKLLKVVPQEFNLTIEDCRK